ncbi:MAG: hypothetical protein LBG62_01625 [Candidatus Methanoplasma sp.]|nr:hypothetical protein [Candidatus Methanoplasma sp.]
MRLDGLSRDPKESFVRQRHPAFGAGPQAERGVESSPAVRRLNREGYATYNVNEKDEVYVYVEPDSAYFDDDAPAPVKAEPGAFVGGHSSPAPVARAPPAEAAGAALDGEPAVRFSNALPRPRFEEIDFSEIKVKKSAPARAEGIRGQMDVSGQGGRAAFTEEVRIVDEAEGFGEILGVNRGAINSRNEPAMTSSSAAPAPPRAAPAFEYTGGAGYDVVEIGGEKPPAPAKRKAQSYSDLIEEIKRISGKMPSRAQARAAERDAAPALVKRDLPPFAPRRPAPEQAPAPAEEPALSGGEPKIEIHPLAGGAPMEAAPTSSEAVAPAAPLITEPETIAVPEAPVSPRPASFREAAPEAPPADPVPSAAETVTGLDAPIEVSDPVGEILKLTMPELRIAEEMLESPAPDAPADDMQDLHASMFRI